jgi:hypothetical protein
MSRHDARAVAAAVSAAALAPLPLALAQRVFVSLPVDSRARAACVSRAWRDALADPAQWTRLVVSEEGGIPWARATDVLLLGAVTRARGRLHRLDVTGPHQITPAVLRAVLALNARSLRVLRVHTVATIDEAGEDEPSHVLLLEPLLRAAPQLRVLDACGTCMCDSAPRFMRAQPPFGPLQLRSLQVDCLQSDDADAFRGGLDSVAPFAAALADAALQPTLAHVNLLRADTQRPEVMDALVDAALARPLRKLSLATCTPPAAAPLARLLRGGTLTYLTWWRDDPEHALLAPDAPMLDAAGAALVADALRATTALASLRLTQANLCGDMQAALVLLSALVGHRSLRELLLTRERPATAVEGAKLGAALGALVAADAPALQSLNVTSCFLCDGGLAPIVDALPRNRHLRGLDISDNALSEEYARERLLPAVRANTSLRELQCHDYGNMGPAGADAVALVQRR